jgi:hypothetical protein
VVRTKKEPSGALLIDLRYNLAMRITRQEIKNNELLARKYLEEYKINEELVYDHFGLQTLTPGEYLELKNYFIIRGKLIREVHFHKRRIGIFLYGTENDKLELIEPRIEQVFMQYDPFVEHISFWVKDLDTLEQVFADRILTTFHIEKSKGFKIQGPGTLLIEFRNNEL